MKPAPPRLGSVVLQNRDLVHPTFWRTLQGLGLLTWSGLLTWRRAPGLLALLLANPVLAGVALITMTNDQLAFLEEWSLNLYALLMVPICCLIVGGAMIRDELQAGTLGFLITRPASRGRFFLAKFLCHVAWLEVTLGLNAVFLGLVGFFLGVEGALTLAMWLLAVQTLLIPGFTAVSSVLGLATKRYVLLGVLYGAIVETAIGQIPTNINVLSLSRHFRALMSQCPVLEIDVPLPTWGVLGSILSVVLLTLVFLGAAATWFSLREFLETEEPSR